MRTLIIALLVANLVVGVALILAMESSDTSSPSPSLVVDAPPVMMGDLVLLDDLSNPPRLRRDAAPRTVTRGTAVPAEVLPDAGTSDLPVAQAAASPVPRGAASVVDCVMLGPFPDGLHAQATLEPHLRDLGVAGLDRIDATRFHEVQLPLPDRLEPPVHVPAALAARLAAAGFHYPRLDTRDGQPVLLLETRQQRNQADSRLQTLRAAGYAAVRVVATDSGDWLRLRLAPPMHAPVVAVAARAGVRLLSCPPEPL